MAKTFKDDDIISIISQQAGDGPSVGEELARGVRLYNARMELKKKKEHEIKPLHEDCVKREMQASKIPVYKLQCVTRTEGSKDPRCRIGAKTAVIDRDTLTEKQHISYLAQPKRNRKCEPTKITECYYIKRYLPNCTPRIDVLALPDKQRVKETLTKFKGKLTPKQVDHLNNLLVEKNVGYTSIKRAISLCIEERKQRLARRAETLRQLTDIKSGVTKTRKCQVKHIVYSMAEIMKEFLMTEHEVDLTGNLRKLSDVLLQKLSEFLGLPVPDRDAMSVSERFLITLADNLALWIDKFSTNFGFEQTNKKEDIPKKPDTCVCVEREQKRQIPLDDFIPLSSTEEEYLSDTPSEPDPVPEPSLATDYEDGEEMGEMQEEPAED